MKQNNSINNLLKIGIIITIFVLLYRLFKSSFDKINLINNNEGFQNSESVRASDRIYGNLYNVTDVSYNTDKTECILTFQEKIRLDSLILKLEKENVNDVILEPVVLLYKDGENNFDENFIQNNDELNHTLDDNKLVVLKNPLNKFALPIVTNAIKVKLLGESTFVVKKHWIYGMVENSMSRTAFANFNGRPMTAPNISSSTDIKQPNHEIFKYSFDKNIKCYAVSFKVSFNTDIISGNASRLNMSVPVEIHYKGLDGGSYKIENTFNTNDFVSTTMLYLPAPILTNTIFIKIPKQFDIQGTNIYINGISDEKFIATEEEAFTDNKNNSRRKTIKRKEKFQGDFSDGYSADDVCPSLEAMEEKLRLTDQICARLEYNDKIKNERIKLERNKQYILKLKQQDDEIKKLENIVRSLQDKRENRDAYNDALRLAQLEKQKRQAATIQDLAQERVNHRKSNVVNVDVNLKNKPLF